MSAPLDTLFAEKEDLDLRLDKFLIKKFPTYSRTYFQSLIEQGHILVNGTSCKKREKLSLGDEIEICFELKPEIDLKPENIPLDILFEDEDLLIINKPAGMVVHPAPGHYTGTFVNALIFYCQSISSQDPLRPGIVHRLDKDTSGALIAAKTPFAHQALVTLFSERKVKKIYKTICLGLPSLLQIDAPIKRHPTKRQEMGVFEGGKKAVTKLQILAQTPDLSLLQVELITGRTHQIRVHLKHINCPILGDPVYGRETANKKWKISRQMLHAEEISFIHPKTNKLLQIKAPLASDMKDLIEKSFPKNK